MTAAVFGLGHTHVFGNFVDPLHSAQALRHYVGGWAGGLLAVALLDLSLIGASAVTLSSSYALGDVLKRRHSLHWKIGQAKGFYAAFAASIVVSAALVLIPHVPLGTVTVGVQALAGILLTWQFQSLRASLLSLSPAPRSRSVSARSSVSKVSGAQRTAGLRKNLFVALGAALFALLSALLLAGHSVDPTRIAA